MQLVGRRSLAFCGLDIKQDVADEDAPTQTEAVAGLPHKQSGRRVVTPTRPRLRGRDPSPLHRPRLLGLRQPLRRPEKADRLVTPLPRPDRRLAERGPAALQKMGRAVPILRGCVCFPESDELAYARPVPLAAAKKNIALR